MSLTRRFTLRPEQKAAIEETRKAEQAAVPVEEVTAIEIMVPEPPAKAVEEVQEPVTEPKEEMPKEESVESSEQIPEKVVTEPAAEAVQEDKPEAEAEKTEEPEELKKPKRTKKSSKKTESAAEKTADEPEIINVSNTLNKNQELQDAVQSVVSVYTDTAFEDFKEQLEQDLLRTAFDERADTGMIRIILSNLGRCFDNVTRQYAKVNANLEQLTNKSYGLIPRQIVMNSNGVNEVSRKQNGVHAPEVYKLPNGKTMNLYALQAGLEAEAIYLQMIMKQLEYKRSTLIAYLTAHKIEAGIIGE